MANHDQRAATNRIPAVAFTVESVFGEKIPKCRECGLYEMVEIPALATWECRECGRREASENVRWVPKDERVRESERESLFLLNIEKEFVMQPQEQNLTPALVERWRREAVTAPAQDRLWLNRCEALCNALRHAQALATTAGWVVLTDPHPVNAFAMEGDQIPDPRLYEDGYSIALGTDPDRRVRIEKRSRDRTS